MSLLAIRFRPMLSFRTPGERIIMRLPLKTWKRALVKTRLAMQRSISAQSKPFRTVCNTSGLTHVASINQITLSFQRLSILCFSGTEMRLNATCICRTFQPLALLRMVSSPRGGGNRPFRKADGLLEAGRSKSLLLQDLSNFFPRNGNGLVISNH